MSIYKTFQTDKTVEKEGVWFEYGKNDRTDLPIRFRIARAGGSNRMFNQRLEALTKPYRRAIQNETIDNATLEKFVQQAFIETCLLAWEAVDIETTDNGPEILDAQFTVENANRLFLDLPDLYSDLQDQGRKSAAYRASIGEAIAKK